MEKTDYDGKPVWQKTFSQDGNEVLASELETPYDCKGLAVSNAGNIVWATTVEPKTLVHMNGQDILPEDQQPFRPKLETIVFLLDRMGNEIHRTISKDADIAYIFSLAEGFSLIEHFRPHVPDAVLSSSPLFAAGRILRADSTGGGIRVKKLDTNLQVLKINEYKIPELNNRLGAVFPQKNGGYFVAGCAYDSVQGIAYLSADNNMPDVTKISPSNVMYECAKFGWTQNPSTNDLLLYAGNKLNGYRLLTINDPHLKDEGLRFGLKAGAEESGAGWASSSHTLKPSGVSA